MKFPIVKATRGSARKRPAPLPRSALRRPDASAVRVGTVRSTPRRVHMSACRPQSVGTFEQGAGRPLPKRELTPGGPRLPSSASVARSPWICDPGTLDTPPDSPCSTSSAYATFCKSCHSVFLLIDDRRYCSTRHTMVTSTSSCAIPPSSLADGRVVAPPPAGDVGASDLRAPRRRAL